ncbi:MAG: hypothetical protein U5N58_09565 [Actinomycetota bacterium]|nr:hypothetical protein [Actinomycetota bacterium]
MLDVSGNIYIDGDLTLGIERWWPEHPNTLYFKGKGTIYTSELLILFVILNLLIVMTFLRIVL